MIGMAILAGALATTSAAAPGAAPPVWNVTVQSERDLRAECSTASEGMRECLEAKARASSVELKEAQIAALTAVSGWNEDQRYIVAASSKLASAEQAFVRYRTAQCAFAFALGGGAIGNALDVRRLACEAEQNLIRASQLRAAAFDLQQRSGGNSR